MISWLISHLALVVGFLLAALLVAQLIRQHRPPTATIAWLLLIIAFPYVGVPLFLLIGGRKVRKLSAHKKDIYLSANETLVSGRSSEIERLLSSYGIPPAIAGNRLQLQENGEQSFRALIHLIDEAARSISVCLFILHPDKVGQEVLNHLVSRARAGVRVCLLLDGVGSLHTQRNFLTPLAQAGGSFTFFMPVLHHPLRGRGNLRNHRKVVIADDRRLLAGGANVASEYMGPNFRPDRWRDLTFTLEGPAVKPYVEIFRYDWSFATGEWLAQSAHEPVSRKYGDAIVQVIPSGPDVPGDSLYDALLAAIFSSRHRLWIITPYFIPDEALSRALILAVHRGVDVRVLVPLHSNHRLADVAGRSYLRELQQEGARVLYYETGMVHAKVVLMDDDIAMLGSANIDMRSLLLNYEAAIFVYSAPEIRAVAAWMSALMEEARGKPGDVGAMTVWLESLARLLAPQL